MDIYQQCNLHFSDFQKPVSDRYKKDILSFFLLDISEEIIKRSLNKWIISLLLLGAYMNFAYSLERLQYSTSC